MNTWFIDIIFLIFQKQLKFTTFRWDVFFHDPKFRLKQSLLYESIGGY